jgi:hypothetical protein
MVRWRDDVASACQPGCAAGRRPVPGRTGLRYPNRKGAQLGRAIQWALYNYRYADFAVLTATIMQHRTRNDIILAATFKFNRDYHFSLSDEMNILRSLYLKMRTLCCIFYLQDC